MSEIPLKEIIDSALSRIGGVADVNTAIGDPITLPGDVTVIPFSKVSVGFTSGGSEFAGKRPKSDGGAYFAGGNGAGVSVTPMGFIAVENGRVRLISLADPSSYGAPNDPVNKALDGINGVIDKAPEIFGKVKDMIADRKARKAEKQAAEEEEILAEELEDEKL